MQERFVSLANKKGRFWDDLRFEGVLGIEEEKRRRGGGRRMRW